MVEGVRGAKRLRQMKQARHAQKCGRRGRRGGHRDAPRCTGRWGERQDALSQRERERGCASAHGQATDEENDQHPSTDDGDIPGIPPTPPEPPDGPARPENKSPSVELKGGRKSVASCDTGPTAGEMDASGVSEGNEDPRNRPNVAQNTSECERERSKGRSPNDSPEEGRDDRGNPNGEAHTSGASGHIEDVKTWPRRLRDASERISKRPERTGRNNSPGRPREEPNEPGGETVVPGGVHNVQEGPEDDRNERVDGTNAPCRGIGPGGHLEVQRELRGVKVDLDRQTVVWRAGYSVICPRSSGNARGVETNPLRRDRGPGGHRGEEASGGVEDDRERESGGRGVVYDGDRCRMDGATSGARHDSKRVGTKLLAGDEEGQHERREYKTAYAPRPFAPPP